MKEACTFCINADSQSRDHCPSKILLEEPLPKDLSVVPSCKKCNESFSLDEEYVACAIEILKPQYSEFPQIKNEKILNILTAKPELKNQLYQIYESHNVKNKELIKDIRFENVLIKNALGHIKFELGLFVQRIPKEFYMFFLTEIGETFRKEFESSVSEPNFFPEVGSRLLIRLFEGQDLGEKEWIVVQNGVYRFQLKQSANKVRVKIVIKEFIAAEIHFESEFL